MTLRSENYQTVRVELDKFSYNIFIGSDLLSNYELLLPFVCGKNSPKKIAIVTNQKIADLYLAKLLPTFSNHEVITIILEDGETNKNQASLNRIYDALINNHFARDCILIAFGGGIVGDITGFAAATYQRGVDFIQIPTTLLAQVDSSVGGKTAINHQLGKNMIGAFYQPKTVIIDINVLQTLDSREVSAGLAEVIKYGLIGDKAFINYLHDNIENILEQNADTLIETIKTSCQHKATIVSNDEKETGIRATLNLGHTFGHAIEAITNYECYLHGEAVAIGTLMAAELSKQLGMLSEQDIDLIIGLFKKAKCPTSINKSITNKYLINPKNIRNKMQLDKKVSNNQLKLILLKQLGQAVITTEYCEEKLLNSIARFIES